MQDNLVGRVVGFEVSHQPHPSHLKPGKPARFRRSVWGRVVHPLPFNNVLVEDGTGEGFVVRRDIIHTVMPESY